MTGQDVPPGPCEKHGLWGRPSLFEQARGPQGTGAGNDGIPQRPGARREGDGGSQSPEPGLQRAVSVDPGPGPRSEQHRSGATGPALRPSRTRGSRRAEGARPSA